MSRLPRWLLGTLALALLASAGPRLEPPVARTLPNGLRVVVFERPGLPIVQMQLQVPAGLRSEPAGQPGIAFLTSQLLRHGTTSRGAEDLATELDTLGATFAAQVSRDAAQVAAGCRVAEFESLLELLSDVVVNPLFSEEAFQAARRQMAAQLGQQAQNPVAIADERAAAVMFGAHPYGNASRGTIESLLAANRDQVRAFHRDHWRPDGAVLAIAGDVDPARAFASVAEWFARWSAKRAAAPAAVSPAPRTGTLLLDLPGSPAAEIRLLSLAPGRGEPGFAGWTLATAALEGGLLPAGARAVLVPAREASLFMVSATARPESAGVVAARLRSAVRALPGTERDGGLAALRARARGAWAFSLETHGQLLSTWLAGDAAGLPAGHLTAWPESLAAATTAGAAHALAGGGTLLLVGPAERMRGALRTLGRVDTLGAGAGPVGEGVAPVTAEDRRRGRQLVEAAVAAHGGAKLGSVRSTYYDGEVHMSPGGNEVVGEMRFLRVDPARLVYTSRFLDFELRQVMDGDRGWALSQAADSAALLPADSTALAALRVIFASDLVHLLRDASAPGADPVARGSGELDGRPVERVEFTSPFAGRTRLSLDRESRRLVGVDQLPLSQGRWRDQRRWSEFVQVDGVWWPRQEVREVDGEQVSRFMMRRISVNGEVDSTVFRRPIVRLGKVRGVE
jgi:predicted Zn-dependent peptidase